MEAVFTDPLYYSRKFVLANGDEEPVSIESVNDETWKRGSENPAFREYLQCRKRQTMCRGLHRPGIQQQSKTIKRPRLCAAICGRVSISNRVKKRPKILRDGLGCVAPPISANRVAWR